MLVQFGCETIQVRVDARQGVDEGTKFMVENNNGRSH